MAIYKINNSGALQYLTFPFFEDTGLVKHAFSTRKGGVSPPPYESLNLGFHVGDEACNVLENRERLGRALEIDIKQSVSGAQVHGDKVKIVTEKDKGRGASSEEDAIPRVDALITNLPGIPLASYYADCVPVYILDPVKTVVALAHAGWKGTVLQIAQKTVGKMTYYFNSIPANCMAVIGPSIGQCCYKVDLNVVNEIKTNFSNWVQFVVPASEEEWYLDLVKINKKSLLDAGLKCENIVISGLCTACSSEMFFSHRISGGRTGRMASVIELKP